MNFVKNKGIDKTIFQMTRRVQIKVDEFEEDRGSYVTMR